MRHRFLGLHYYDDYLQNYLETETIIKRIALVEISICLTETKKQKKSMFGVAIRLELVPG